MDSYPFSHVWKTLSQIDSKDLANVTYNGIAYVPWMRCHQQVVLHFADYQWEFLQNEDGLEVFFYPGGTCEVRIRMCIAGNTRTISLPVKQNNKAIVNPDTFQINTAKQRARAKCFAEFGLFADLWGAIDEAEEQEEVGGTPDTGDTKKKPAMRRKPAPKKLVAEKESPTIESIWLSLKDNMYKADSRESAQKCFAGFEQQLRNALGDIEKDDYQQYADEYGAFYKNLPKSKSEGAK
tara:strand:- start:3783 stop:4493 length:711 start_codon:yes stop_codon:yes gene_type:complete